MIYYTQADVARIVGVNQSSVSRRIKDGQLATIINKGGTKMIPNAAVGHWIAERLKRRRHKLRGAAR